MKATTILIAAVQVLVIVCGFVAVGIVLKFSGYPENPRWVHWNPLAIGLRHFGLGLLVFPIIWTIIAARADSGKPAPVNYRTLVAIGGAFAVVTMCLFIYAATCAYSRSGPLFSHPE